MCQLIGRIEKALGIELMPWQKDFITKGNPIPGMCPCMVDMPGMTKEQAREKISYRCQEVTHAGFCYAHGRRTGKTIAHCIRLALSEGPPLDMRRPDKFCDCDYGNESNKITYARGIYRRMFYDVWRQLRDAGLPVREIKK